MHIRLVQSRAKVALGQVSQQERTKIIKVVIDQRNRRRGRRVFARKVMVRIAAGKEIGKWVLSGPDDSASARMDNKKWQNKTRTKPC